MRQTVKIAAVQTAPVAFDLAQSIAKVAHFTAEAAKSGADLIIFPYVSHIPLYLPNFRRFVDAVTAEDSIPFNSHQSSHLVPSAIPASLTL
jgi:predicted amidohydrolase